MFRSSALSPGYFLINKIAVMAIFALLATGNRLAAQELQGTAPNYKPLRIELSDDGSRYVRFIFSNQVWLESSNLADPAVRKDANVSIRRSRFIAYSQVSPRVLVLTHWGVNNFNASGMTKTGNDGDAPQLFLHDAWTEFKVADQLYLGGGLHYWRGLTRLSSQGTLNMMTLDQPRPFVHWHSLGYTDQYVRHLGLYAKGQIGDFEYRLSWNQSGKNGFESGALGDEPRVVYNGINIPDRAGQPTGHHLFEGYVSYNLWDRENNTLPFRAGSYLGTRRVLNVGAGFFLQPDGAYDGARSAHLDVKHFAVDAFLDMPVGKSGSVTAYASYIHYDYGPNWVGRWAGTGHNRYIQAGYFFKKLKFMPYLALSNGLYEGNAHLDWPQTNSLNAGANYFINGHNAKLTLEYHRIRPASNKDAHEQHPSDIGQIRLQACIFL